MACVWYRLRIGALILVVTAAALGQGSALRLPSATSLRGFGSGLGDQGASVERQSSREFLFPSTTLGGSSSTTNSNYEQRDFADGDDLSIRNHWALLVAGSAGWGNYRHQADVCHAYQVLTRGGLRPAHIVVMMYDDIAYDPYNPVPGQVFNSPGGPDVYGGVRIDYRGVDVNAATFLAVLEGNARALPPHNGTGRVLASGPRDRIFVFYSDHGSPGVLGMPSGSFLYADQLVGALQRKYDKGGYKEAVLYIEACESGSMFEGLLPRGIGAYATTASNAFESSWGTYCPGMAPGPSPIFSTCLGDLYSVAWMENADYCDLTHETLMTQYDIIRNRTSHNYTYAMGSHVMQYGSLAITREVAGDYQGMRNRGAEPEGAVVPEGATCRAGPGPRPSSSPTSTASSLSSSSSSSYPSPLAAMSTSAVRAGSGAAVDPASGGAAASDGGGGGSSSCSSSSRSRSGGVLAALGALLQRVGAAVVSGSGALRAELAGIVGGAPGDRRRRALAEGEQGEQQQQGQGQGQQGREQGQQQQGQEQGQEQEGVVAGRLHSLPQREADLAPLRHRQAHGGSPEERQEAQLALDRELSRRQSIDSAALAAASGLLTQHPALAQHVMAAAALSTARLAALAVDASVARANGADGMLVTLLAREMVHGPLGRPAPGKPLVDDWDCLRAMVAAWGDVCGPMDQYAMRHTRLLANLCNAGVAPGLLAETMRSAGGCSDVDGDRPLQPS